MALLISNITKILVGESESILGGLKPLFGTKPENLRYPNRRQIRFWIYLSRREAIFKTKIF